MIFTDKKDSFLFAENLTKNKFIAKMANINYNCNDLDLRHNASAEVYYEPNIPFYTQMYNHPQQIERTYFSKKMMNLSIYRFKTMKNSFLIQILFLLKKTSSRHNIF